MTQRKRSYTEEESLADLAATKIGPRTARWMSWLFVVTIVSVPLLQTGVEMSRHQPPRVLRLFQPIQASLAQAAHGSADAAWHALEPLASADYLQTYEDDLQRQSLFRQSVQPWLQAGLAALGGFGNSDCVIGRHGWLFYQPGLEFLVGPGLLDPAHLQARARKHLDKGDGEPPHPDPRPAILQLHKDCRQAGVRLILVPVPDKGMMQPAQLTRRLKRDGTLPVLNNTGYQPLVEELRSKGIEVLDPAPGSVLPWEERYLVHDTHWTPEFMEETAKQLAAYVQATAIIPVGGTLQTLVSIGIPRNPPCMGYIEKKVCQGGDLVGMLRLPRRQAIFPAQTVTIHPVVDLTHNHLWRSDPKGDVLLLGDSFTNIYSDGVGDEGLGWGRCAGFAAHLSLYLDGRGVDVIARNGAGATQVRAELARRPHPLQGKKILIWQFAARELALGDWKPLPLTAHAEEADAADGPLVVEATIVAASRAPAPFSVPYRDCLIFNRVRIDRIVQGECGSDQVIAAFWGLKDNELQPPARFQVGDRLRLRLVPLFQAAGSLQTVRFADDLNDCTHPTYLVEEEDRP